VPKKEGDMRAEFLGVPIDLLTFDQTVDIARRAMETRQTVQHVALNVAKLVKAQTDIELRRDVSESDIVGIDGMGIVWGARALGVDVPERVPGVDLMERLLALCAAQGFRPYLLGARREVLERAMTIASRRWPGLGFAGAHDGYFTAADEPSIVAGIRDSHADCLFIAMPTPHKERFLHRYRSSLNVPFIMGVGGAFDVLAGQTRRAPAAMQQAGLEWLYRTWQEPRRMWWRYASTNAAYARLLGREFARMLRARIFAAHAQGGL
jgi:N-acetylglucosaminyldiphosphoundecaprenol N-acetyl-beta-D-mannosaminyltransferase